jgi:hypothetical protein
MGAPNLGSPAGRLGWDYQQKWRPTRLRTRADDIPLHWTTERERYHFLASYYRWCAARPWPTLPGNDPIRGDKPNGHDPLTARMARAAYIALAREALAIARTFGPSPLP